MAQTISDGSPVEYYYVADEEGCAVWTKPWSVESMQATDMVVAPTKVLRYGAEIQVKLTPEFLVTPRPDPDDNFLNSLPLSMIRGSVHGVDDHGRTVDSIPQPSKFHWLEMVSPFPGWILDTTIELGTTVKPGRVTVLMGRVLQSSRWLYRVVCDEGAVVRTGLELTTTHLHTLRQHSVVEVSERRVNQQGLARFKTADGRGWISEQLNPLSGHRGAIISPLGMPKPLQFRVCLPEGAVVRSSVELCSAHSIVLPKDEVISVVSKTFSNHPAEHCIPRLRLSSGGWISQRLNTEPPHDKLVVKLIGITPTGSQEADWVNFELSEDLRPYTQQPIPSPPVEDTNSPSNPHTSTATPPPPPEASTSSEPPEPILHLSLIQDRTRRPGVTHIESLTASFAKYKLMRESVEQPETQDRDGGDVGLLDPNKECIVCLAATRTATIVHGQTGHIACCMDCARVLKARGDKCPVCRMDIDLVIQHFWA